MSACISADAFAVAIGSVSWAFFLGAFLACATGTLVARSLYDGLFVLLVRTARWRRFSRSMKRFYGARALLLLAGPDYSSIQAGNDSAGVIIAVVAAGGLIAVATFTVWIVQKVGTFFGRDPWGFAADDARRDARIAALQSSYSGAGGSGVLAEHDDEHYDDTPSLAAEFLAADGASDDVPDSSPGTDAAFDAGGGDSGGGGVSDGW